MNLEPAVNYPIRLKAWIIWARFSLSHDYLETFGLFVMGLETIFSLKSGWSSSVLVFQAREEEELAEARRREEVERQKLEEAEKFEKKLDGKRKRRNRRTTSENVETSSSWRRPVIAGVVSVAVAALSFYFYQLSA